MGAASRSETSLASSEATTGDVDASGQCEPAGSMIALLPVRLAARSGLETDCAQAVAGRLDRIAWEPGLDRQQQQRLQHRYVFWSAPIEARRRQAFGVADLRRDLDVASSADWWKWGVFTAFAAFMSSAVRSPVANALFTKLNPGHNQPGELGTTGDALAVGCLVASIVHCYLFDKLFQPAFEDSKKTLGVPSLVPTELTLLHPEPGPVHLHLTQAGGRRFKRFFEAATGDGVPAHGTQGLEDAPTAPALQTHADRRRRVAALWQTGAQSRGAMGLAKPMLGGLAHLARRALSTDSQLTSPASVLLGSMAASGLAAFTHSLASTLIKASLREEVSDLAGGTYRLPVFRQGEPGGGRAPPPTWLAVAQQALRRGVVDLPQNAQNLALAARQDPAALAADGLAHGFANAFAAWAARGDGLIWRGIVSPHGVLDQLPGESLRSPGNLLSQLFGSAVGDYLFSMIYSDLHGAPFVAAKSADRYRETQAAKATRPSPQEAGDIGNAA